MQIIEVKNLSYSIKTNVILDNISFNIDAGDYVGLVGPNGGGKTTLLKILVGLIKPNSGEIKILGKDMREFKNNSVIGYVPQRVIQEGGNFPVTVYEIVESGLLNNKSFFQKISETDKELVSHALKIAGIEHLSNTLIANLSGGQKQRVFVARAIVGNPKLLILDEPFTGVDINAQRDFYEFLKKLNLELNLTILFVSHDIDVISDEAKSIICLNKNLFCLDSPTKLHESNMIEQIYGKKITHIHHNH